MGLVQIHEPRVIELSEPEKAWLACLIDSEGSIIFTKNRDKSAKTGWRWRILISITNTNLAFLEKTRAIAWGGRIYRIKATRPNHKDNYHLHISSVQCQWLLPKIHPYLIIKKRKAEIALQALDILQLRLGRGKNKNLIIETDQQLEALLKEFQEVQEA